MDKDMAIETARTASGASWASTRTDSWAVEYKLQTESDDLILSERPIARDEVEAWMEAETENENSTTKLLAHQVPDAAAAGRDAHLTAPDSLWNIPGVQRILTPAATGSSLTHYPKRTLKVQTPLDDGPVCAFTLQFNQGFDYRGIYYYTDPSVSPVRILQDAKFLYRWRWQGLAFVIVPIGFLKAHIAYVAKTVLKLNQDMAALEDVMSERRDPDDQSLDLGELTRQAHLLSARLSRVERRGRFQSDLLKLIVDALTSIVGGGGGQRADLEIRHAHLDQLEKDLQAWDYDFESLPKRLETARMTIFNLIVQRDQRQGLALNRANMQIAESSRIMAEATMRDSASMKTIAILTMVFLPGTAVASFFSMTMFNWSPANSGDGSDSLASSYIWVYFVCSVPLTGMVLGLWWYTTQRRQKRILARSRTGTMQNMLTYNGRMTGSTMLGRGSDKVDEAEDV